MNRRKLLALGPSAAAITAVGAMGVGTTGDARPGRDDYERLTRQAVEDIRSRLPRGAFIHHNHFALLEQPGILAAASFVVEVEGDRWARPAVLNFLRYGRARDVDILVGDELLNLSMHHSRPWDVSDPTDWLSRWQMVLDDTVDAILERVRQVVA